MTSREVIQLLEKAGWELMKGRGKGSHSVLRHPNKPGRVTVPKGEMKTGTLKSIERATGVKLKPGG